MIFGRKRKQELKRKQFLIEQYEQQVHNLQSERQYLIHLIKDIYSEANISLHSNLKKNPYETIRNIKSKCEKIYLNNLSFLDEIIVNRGEKHE